MIIQDLFATVSTLTLSIRAIGGGVGYTIYYNVFLNKFTANATYYIGGVMVEKLGITDPTVLIEAIKLTSVAELAGLMEIPGIAGNEEA